MAKRKDFEEIYSDESIIVVLKEAGIAVVPTRDPLEKSVVKLLQQRHDQHIFVVHRIDRETSGLVVFAKDEASHKNLNQQFFKREVDKVYTCISEGASSMEECSIRNRLSLDSHTHKMKADPRGKDAISHYKAIETSKKFSLNSIRIDTGRTHQIRVHMAGEGYPILGDKLYNNRPETFLSSIKKNYRAKGRYDQEQALIRRCALHANYLSFEHPVTRKKVEFEAEMPKDMRACWKQIMKWDSPT